MAEPVADPWLSLELKLEPERQAFVLVIPLGLSLEQRGQVMQMLSDVLDSMRRVYEPRPCPCCKGSGDARDASPAAGVEA